MMPFIAVLFSLLNVHPAEAGCRNNKPICGSTKICHSDTRATNKNDLNQPLHPKLCEIMNKMTEKFGNIEVAAAYRSDNAARDGAPNSVHLKKPGGPTYAVDLVVNASRKDKYTFLGGQKCKGIRYNVYCDTGTVHMDISGKSDNYSHCPDFFRTACEDGSTPNIKEKKSDKVQEYKNRKIASPARPRCYQQRKYGSCCGAARKRAGHCSG